MVGKVGAQLRELAGNFVKALLVLAFQADAGLLGIADLQFDAALLGSVERVPVVPVAQGTERVVKGPALLHAQAKGNDLGQDGFVRLAQGVGVFDAEQVADGPPGIGEGHVDLFQGLEQAVPGGLGVLLSRGDARFGLLEQAVNGRLYVFGRDLVVAGQAFLDEQGVVFCGHGYVAPVYVCDAFVWWLVVY